METTQVSTPMASSVRLLFSSALSCPSLRVSEFACDILPCFPLRLNPSLPLAPFSPSFRPINLDILDILNILIVLLNLFSRIPRVVAFHISIEIFEILTCDRSRCHCAGPVRYWQDRYFLHLRSPEDRPQRQAVPGAHSRPHP